MRIAPRTILKCRLGRWLGFWFAPWYRLQKLDEESELNLVIFSQPTPELDASWLELSSLGLWLQPFRKLPPKNFLETRDVG